MTPTVPAPPATRPAAAPPGRLLAGPLVALAFSLLVGFLVVGISFSLSREYGDTSASDVEVAGRALRDWAVGIVVAVGLAALVAVMARRSRGRRVLTLAATLMATATLLGVPLLAVVGVHQKFEGFPRVPSCTDGFATGPAVPVVRAAQAAFEEIDHPGPFSGGGESGLGGCATQLMLRGEVDVAGAYRRALPAAGWQPGRVEPDRVEATRGGQRFTASRDGDGAWWVRIGPATDPGQP